jgi:serine protease AprX
MQAPLSKVVWSKAVWGKAVWGPVVALWLMVPASAAAQPRHLKIDRPLSELSPSAGPQRVIIRTKPGTGLHVRRTLQAHGHSVIASHQLIDAVTARVDAADIAALANDPNVESISVDAKVTASQFSLAGLNLDEALGSVSDLRSTLGLSGLLTGANVTATVIDSGLAPGPDFEGRVVGFYDFSNGQPGQYGPAFDDFGHGTHVAGLIGSSGKSSDKKFAGIASGVKLLPLKVLDRNGAGYTSDVIRALEFAVANRTRFKIRIVNLSLGHPIYESAATDPLVQAVEHAVRAGLIVVTAAGNHGMNQLTGRTGYAGITSPGNAPSAITVGAANTQGTVGRGDDRVSSFSSRGPSWYDGIAKPDIVAPGDGMISNVIDSSVLALTYPSLIVRNGSATYLRLNGSSMATGVISGVVALMLEANHYGEMLRSLESRLFRRTSAQAPPLSASAIKAMLQFTATPLRDAEGKQYDVLTQGSGLVNGYAAALLAGFADTTKPAGAYWMSTTIQPWTRFDGTAEPWSQTVVWGTRILQGSSLVELNQLAWDDNIVWGTGELDSIVWGTAVDADNIVWGTTLGVTDISWFGNAMLGDNIVWGTADWMDNIVWGTGLLGTFDGDNIVWGTFSEDNIVWGTLSDDNIVWGTNDNTITVLGASLIGGGL